MIGLFVVGGAIFNTGLAKIIGAKMLALGGGSTVRLFLLVMGATALIGAFVSNTGTVALMLPIVVSMAAGSNMPASRLLMPLAFASSMGGMMTLIGTPPNIVISEVWEEAGHEPLSFFTFLPGGLICCNCRHFAAHTAEQVVSDTQGWCSQGGWCAHQEPCRTGRRVWP